MMFLSYFIIEMLIVYNRNLSFVSHLRIDEIELLTFYFNIYFKFSIKLLLVCFSFNNFSYNMLLLINYFILAVINFV